MNALPDNAVNRALRTHLSGTKRIDYLYYDRATPRRARVEPLRSSDHRSVVGQLTLDAAHAC